MNTSPKIGDRVRLKGHHSDHKTGECGTIVALGLKIEDSWNVVFDSCIEEFKCSYGKEYGYCDGYWKLNWEGSIDIISTADPLVPQEGDRVILTTTMTYSGYRHTKGEYGHVTKYGLIDDGPYRNSIPHAHVIFEKCRAGFQCKYGQEHGYCDGFPNGAHLVVIHRPGKFNRWKRLFNTNEDTNQKVHR